ncbi:hypothetical protein ACELLULO517_19810 [Acidisoma cellulosilytica]|uniref:Uncharacterized protein n=1 Tax=Acidisoma cellulosilyticum TaxID=2802395 RepID=A0A963Z4A2_9PROT|nr:hypothetical protein [Acidisoma cellulosilyticum]MCB8882502.1 hypothetical protein [Acidisoma cellulosilyticum]
MDEAGAIPLIWQYSRHAMRALLIVMVTTCLVACTDEHVTTYRHDHKAFLKELIYCENHYEAARDSDACRAAFHVNSELFPG